MDTVESTHNGTTRVGRYLSKTREETRLSPRLTEETPYISTTIINSKYHTLRLAQGCLVEVSWSQRCESATSSHVIVDLGTEDRASVSVGMPRYRDVSITDIVGTCTSSPRKTAMLQDLQTPVALHSYSDIVRN